MEAGSISVTVLIAARNEAANLSRCLDACRPAARVVVFDSASTDETAAIAEEAGARVVQFRYQGGYPKKRQWALNHLDFDTGWILLLDADEVVPEALWSEISEVVQRNSETAGDENSTVHGYLITKGFHFMGRRFRYGGFSHQAVLLIRNGKARFEELIQFAGDSLDMEVHERVIVDGPVGVLKTPLIHEDFKGLEAYIDKHNRYSTWEAQLRHSLLTTGQYGTDSVKAKLFGNAQERRRWLKRLAVRMPFEPSLWFLWHYIWKLGFLEGRRGLIASQIRCQYIANVRAKLFEHRFKSESKI